MRPSVRASANVAFVAALVIAAPSRGLVHVGSAATPGRCEIKGTVMYYGNGIMTTYDQAWEIAVDDLPGLADEAKVGDVVEVDVAYNHTDGFLEDVIQTLEQKQAEDSRFGWFLLNNITSYLVRGLNVVGVLRLPDGSATFIAALQAVINEGIVSSNHQDGTFYDSDVAEQVSNYRATLRSKGRAIVVAHSQGNLYANASHAALLAGGGELGGSFGIVAVATPTEISFNGYVTSNNDAVINALRSLGRTVLAANVSVPTTSRDFLGHGFEDVYINTQLPARAAVVELLSRVSADVPYPPSDAGTCHSRCPSTSGDGAAAVLTGSLLHGEEKTYSIDVGAGYGVVIRVADVGDSNFAPRFDVFGPAGELVASDSAPNVANSAFHAVSAGRYKVVVSDGSSSSTAAGVFTLYYVIAPGANRCGALVPGEVVSEHTDKGELDSYTFAAQMGEGIILRVTDVAGGAYFPGFSVYDPVGNLVADGVGPDVASSGFQAGSSGTFTVVVYDADLQDATGDYNLYFTRAPGANRGGALSPGQVVSEHTDKGELDSYTFAAQMGEGIILRVTDVAGAAYFPGFSVYGPLGNLVADGLGPDVASSRFQAASSGTYTVAVYDASNFRDATGDYNLYFTRAPGANRGGALSPGQVVSGHTDKGELDSYVFVAQVGDRILLRVTDVDGGAYFPGFSVYGPVGNLVADGLGPDVASSTFQAASSGTYTVVVYDASNPLDATGDYSLLLTISLPLATSR